MNNKKKYTYKKANAAIRNTADDNKPVDPVDHAEEQLLSLFKDNKFKDVKLFREQDASLIPDLMRLEAEFSQEGNTMGTTDEYEDLIITMEYQLPPDPGEEGVGFYTLHTTSGWSVDSPEELTKLIHSVKQAAIRIGEIKNQ